MSAVADRHDPDAELAVIGSALLDSTAHALAAAIVPDPAAFFDPRNALTWQALNALAGRGERTDDITLVAAELRAMDRLTAAGGTEYLGSITDRVPTAAHVERYARVVADHALARRLSAAATRVAAYSADPTHTADDCTAHATEALTEATARPDQRTTSLSDALGQVFTRLESAMGGDEARTVGHSTGLAELDRLTSGLAPGQLWVVAARPAMGKTSLAFQVAAHVARHAGPVLFVSLEMGAQELASRLVAGVARVSSGLMRTLTLGQDHFDALVRAAATLHTLPIEIADGGTATITQVRALALRRAARGKLALIAVDYLQLMQGTGDEDNREGEVSAISRGLKQLAREMDCPVLALSQLSRKCEERKDHRPLLSDLRESGAIEQDADVVAFIYRDEIYNKHSEEKGIAEIIVAKQRSGPTDTLRFRFLQELTRFEPLEQERTTYGSDANWQDGRDEE